MKLKTCSCGVECTTSNVKFLPLIADGIGNLVMFNCQCGSTLSIAESDENFFQIQDLVIFVELEAQIGRDSLNRK
jgi:hypothetical protein